MLSIRAPWVVVGLAFLVGCTSEPTVSLEVRLRTDFQPYRDFLSATVTIGKNAQERRAVIDGAYIDPSEPLATFENLPLSESREIVVALLDAQQQSLVGGEVKIVLEHEKDLILTVSITRRCEVNSCPPERDSDGKEVPQRCLEGRCVPADCVTGSEPSCPPASCQSDDQCTTMSPCAKPRCVDNVCFEDGGAMANCPADEICDIEFGCLPKPTTCQSVDECAQVTECVTADCIANLCIYRFRTAGFSCDSGLGTCQGGLCEPIATCTDGLENGQETGVDCGGPCTGCADGDDCLVGSDCLSGMCHPVTGLCFTPNCMDGLVNQDETDVDCGGMCAKCELMKDCMEHSDCISAVCDTLDSMQCELPNVCGNSIVEGSEACDDGNTLGGDGCSAACKRENGQMCMNDTQCVEVCDNLDSNTCEPVNTCGNAHLEGTETCDDGNLVNDDGCSPTCVLCLCNSSGPCKDGFTATVANSSTTISTSYGGGTGQSFRATTTGLLRSFAFGFRNSYTGPVGVYSNISVNGTAIWSGNVTDVGYLEPMVFDPPVPVTQNSKYTVYLPSSAYIHESESNPYNGGARVSSFGPQEIMADDFVFSAKILSCN